MSRRGVYILLTVLVAVFVYPVVRRPPVDSFPLSNYPMFASRGADVSSFPTVVGIGADGDDIDLTPELIAGTDQVIHAAETIRYAIRNDDTASLCGEIAARVAESRRDVRAIEVVVVRYDAIAWFEGEREPVDRQVFSRCEVQS